MEAIIKVYTFDLTQEIFITDKNSSTGFTCHKIRLTDIPDFLMSFTDLDTIHIFGNANFLSGIIKEIKNKEYAKYEKNKINILINE